MTGAEPRPVNAPTRDVPGRPAVNLGRSEASPVACPVQPGQLVHALIPGPVLATFRPVTTVQQHHDCSRWRLTVAIGDAQATYTVRPDGYSDHVIRPTVHIGWCRERAAVGVYARTGNGSRRVGTLFAGPDGITLHLHRRGIDLRIPPAATWAAALAAHGNHSGRQRRAHIPGRSE